MSEHQGFDIDLEELTRFWDSAVKDKNVPRLLITNLKCLRTMSKMEFEGAEPNPYILEFLRATQDLSEDTVVEFLDGRVGLMVADEEEE